MTMALRVREREAGAAREMPLPLLLLMLVLVLVLLVELDEPRHRRIELDIEHPELVELTVDVFDVFRLGVECLHGAPHAGLPLLVCRVDEFLDCVEGRSHSVVDALEAAEDPIKLHLGTLAAPLRVAEVGFV